MGATYFTSFYYLTVYARFGLARLSKQAKRYYIMTKINKLRL